MNDGQMRALLWHHRRDRSSNAGDELVVQVNVTEAVRCKAGF